MWNQYLSRTREIQDPRHPELLKKFIFEYQNEDWAKDDCRLISRVVEYATKYDPDPLTVFKVAKKSKIGIRNAILYQYWAMEYEKAGLFTKAIEICKEGTESADRGIDVLLDMIEKLEKDKIRSASTIAAPHISRERPVQPALKKRKFGDLLLDTSDGLMKVKSERKELRAVYPNTKENKTQPIESSDETPALENFMNINLGDADSQKENRCPATTLQQQSVSRVLNFNHDEQANATEIDEGCIVIPDTPYTSKILISEPKPVVKKEILEEKQSKTQAKPEKNRAALRPICEDSEYLEIDSPIRSVDSNEDESDEREDNVLLPSFSKETPQGDTFKFPFDDNNYV